MERRKVEVDDVLLKIVLGLHVCRAFAAKLQAHDRDIDNALKRAAKHGYVKYTRHYGWRLTVEGERRAAQCAMVSP